MAGVLIADFGQDYAADVDLSWTSEDDQSQHIATGAALIALSEGANRSRPRGRDGLRYDIAVGTSSG